MLMLNERLDYYVIFFFGLMKAAKLLGVQLLKLFTLENFQHS